MRWGPAQDGSGGLALKGGPRFCLTMRASSTALDSPDIRVHTCSGTDVSGLSHLFNFMANCRVMQHIQGGVSFYLSNVGPIVTAWSCEAAKDLQPTGGALHNEYQHLVFLSRSLTMEATENVD